MTPTYVALDLETTGLSPESCEIIEIGAVRFTLDSEVEDFHTFVRPRGQLPYQIQRLTGIGPQDLQGAPIFAEVASRLQAFLGDLPVVGHNVAFDLGFLAAQGVEPAGPPFDTYDLAGLLLTGLSDYTLRSLADHLGVDFPLRHRALADAQATREVFLRLRSRLAEQPIRSLDEIQRMAAASGWPLQRLFAEILEEAPALAAGASPWEGLAPTPDIGPPLVARTPPLPLEMAEVEAILERPGQRPELFPGFERRPEQLAMACTVAETLNEGGHLVVEAGTGTGKSLAYLAPAAGYALRNSARVVVSTDTINLQEQLVSKDLPILQRLLEGGDEEGAPCESLRFAQLKGRRNYLCLLRLAALRRSPTLSLMEAKLLARILLWLPRTETGDRAELNLSPPQEALWGRVNAESETCLTFSCFYVRQGACFLHRARRRAEASHLLVVNHALLLSDVAVGGHVLPEYQHLVIDEAHNLEEEATQQFGFEASDLVIADFLGRIHQRTRGRPAGLVGSLREGLRGFGSATGSALPDTAAALAAAAESGRRSLPVLFDLLASFLLEHALDGGEYNQRLLLNRAMRVQPDWSEIEMAWENLDMALHDITALLGRTAEGLADAEDGGGLAQEELMAAVSALLQEGQRLREGVASVLGRDDPATIAWLTYDRQNGGITLSAAPLEVADALQSGLFCRRQTVILTGATLSVQGQIDYLCERLGLEEPRQLLLGSPFDYVRSTLLLLPQSMPEPNDLSYLSELEQAVIELCRASEGRALVLFTSHGALRATYAGVKGPLEREEILVLGQGIDGSPKSLLNALREDQRTVVLGTTSFWEGVDVVGEALSLLLIARLPFAVPTDPVAIARSALYDDPFRQYALPQAVLRFKQGFGRLIRRKTDRGVVVVLDRRIRSKPYGSVFLQSLPPCTTREAPLREMPGAVRDWLSAP
jgi:DNA polymerase-3 subunit epsilon/ATP-dependent DNA helicase DinG